MHAVCVLRACCVRAVCVLRACCERAASGIRSCCVRAACVLRVCCACAACVLRACCVCAASVHACVHVCMKKLQLQCWTIFLQYALLREHNSHQVFNCTCIHAGLLANVYTCSFILFTKFVINVPNLLVGMCKDMCVCVVVCIKKDAAARSIFYCNVHFYVWILVMAIHCTV